MNAVCEKEQVKDFLQEVKRAIADKTRTFDTWVLVPREKNKSSLSELGLTYPDIENTLLTLSVSEYCEGPTYDASAKGDCWIFGKIISDKEVYIKLKLASFGTKNPLYVVRIISFHIADDSLCYPYC
ncbi:hypothetical protein ACFLW1_02690 [Chloroflexota bacterium]